MANYLYRGFDAKNNRVASSAVATSESELKSKLEAQSFSDIVIYETKTKIKPGNYKLVEPNELSIFCRQMSVMFYSYITLMEGVQMLEEQSENAQLKLALSEIYGFMDKGYTLAEAMCMYPHIFGDYLLSMVQIGETSGSLDSVFARCADFFDKETKIRKKLRSSLTYPAILAVLMVAIIVLLIVQILPMFSSILNDLGQQMNALTTGILAVGTFLSSYGIVIIVVLAALIVGFMLYTRTDNGALLWDKMKLRLPLLRYVTARTITARFAASLSILVKSGVQLVTALEETKPIINNRALSPKMDKVIEEIEAGTELSEALSKIGVFPPLFLKMAKVGQSTGRLDEMLDKSAVIFDEDVDDAVNKITSLIEPILIIVLSVVVGVILVSVMIPMIDIMNNIG